MCLRKDACAGIGSGGRMLSCPDPVKCSANLRTMWQKSEIQAVEEWNSLVTGYIAKQKRAAKSVRG